MTISAQYVDGLELRIRELSAENATLRDELEVEIMRLSACGTAALGYFEGCKDEYKSASLDDVLRLYAENDTLRQALKNHAEEAAKMVNAWPVLWFDEDTFQISRDKPLRPTYIPLYASPRIPEGWVMVPKEPTPEWCNKFARITIKRWPLDSLRREILHVITAAPKLGE